jgi:protein TonB
MLNWAATDAVKTWKFKPYLSDGKPMEVDTNISIAFTSAGVK